MNAVGAIRTEDQCRNGVCTVKVLAWSGSEWVLMGYGQETQQLAQSSEWVSRRIQAMTVARLASYE